jgi:hypothetical protein
MIDLQMASRLRNFGDIHSRASAILGEKQAIQNHRVMKLFTEHPRSVDESYFEHMGMAFGFGSRLVVSGIACLLHGIFPFLFVKTGSRTVRELHGRMITCRDRQHHCDHLIGPE